MCKRGVVAVYCVCACAFPRKDCYVFFSKKDFSLLSKYQIKRESEGKNNSERKSLDKAVVASQKPEQLFKSVCRTIAAFYLLTHSSMSTNHI